MKRRFFLKTSAAFAGALALPVSHNVSALTLNPLDDIDAMNMDVEIGVGRRRMEVVTNIVVPAHSGSVKIWLPLPLTETVGYQRTLELDCEASHANIREVVESPYNVRMLEIVWPQGGRVESEMAEWQATLKVHLETRDRDTPMAVREKPGSLQRWLAATELLPTDGVVREMAKQITRGAGSDVERARAIYDWVVDHTFSDPKVRGCGTGDVRYMLESNNLGGKCADINAVFVALARAAGVPARVVYGLRAAPSLRGYASLGADGDVSSEQHCRAEFYARNQGWVPVDPADVRRVIRLETGGLRADEARVKAIRDYLFGNWEMNWLAYNYGHDLKLPNAEGAPLPFLMYPNGETAEGRLDQLDPQGFRYSIRARVVDI